MNEKIVVEFDVPSPIDFKEGLRLWRNTSPFVVYHGFRVIEKSVDAVHGDVTLRPALLEFAKQMEIKLRKNDDKKGWREYPIAALRRLLGIEIQELDVAMDFNIGDPVTECVDTANFAMMLADRISQEPEK